MAVADLIEKIAAAELAGRKTVADALARKLDKHRARQAAGNVSSLKRRAPDASDSFAQCDPLFVGSDDAGAVNALFTSLLASCQLFAVEPWSYCRWSRTNAEI